MDFSKFTLKTQEAIQKAQQVALDKGHQTIENAHILKGIFVADDTVAPFLLKKLNVNVALVQQALDKIIERFPKVSGGNMSLSPEANVCCHRAPAARYWRRQR